MLKFINRLTGRSSSLLHLSTMQRVYIFIAYSLRLLRYQLLRIFLKNSASVGFCGQNSKIISGYKVEVGKGISIGRDVTINAFSTKSFKFGNSVTIRDGCRICSQGLLNQSSGKLVIGDNVGLSEGCFIQVRGDVIVGDNVIIGPGAMILSENHIFADRGELIRLQGVKRSGVIIRDDVWIGAGAKILDGVTINRGAIIATGAVVTKTVLEYEIITGVPGKLLKER